MKQLKDFTILDEVKDDGHGHPMKIVSFTVQNMKEPLLFYNCFCHQQAGNTLSEQKKKLVMRRNFHHLDFIQKLMNL